MFQFQLKFFYLPSTSCSFFPPSLFILDELGSQLDKSCLNALKSIPMPMKNGVKNLKNNR